MSDTITAIATPAGEGGVCVIRISGKESLAIASELFRSGEGKSVGEFTPHRIYFGEVR
ncbi:MAG: tRNA uridine-5-carboxymethylaminomethyl(34) synthesis GTPase MnmE, partial [Nitrospinaceae bacterium]